MESTRVREDGEAKAIQDVVQKQAHTVNSLLVVFSIITVC